MENTRTCSQSQPNAGSDMEEEERQDQSTRHGNGTGVSMIFRGHIVKVVMLVALVALHVLLVFRHFPVTSVTRGNPICSGDLGWHLATAAEGDAFIKKQHRVWGYSPNLMAGYPWGLWNSFSKRGYEFASTVFWWMSFETAFYCWVVLTATVTPLILPLACLLFGLPRRIALVCLAVSIVVYQFGNIITGFWMFGNIAFPLVMSLSVLYLSMLFRSMSGRNGKCGGQNGQALRTERECWFWTLPSGAVLGLLFWLHPLSVPVAGAGSLVSMYILRRRLRTTGVWLRLLLIAGIGIALVLPWVLPLLSLASAKGVGGQALESGIKYVLMDFLSDRAYRHHFDRRAFLHIICALGAFGIWRLHRCCPASAEPLSEQINQRPVVAILGGTACVLLVCAALFPYSDLLTQLQPYRYVLSAKVLLLIPATVGLMELRKLWQETNRQGRVICACILTVLFPALFAYVIDRVRCEPAGSLADDERAVAAWCRNVRNGRVLCENGRLGGLLPYLSGCETIGGIISSQAPLKTNFSGVVPEQVFGFCRKDKRLTPAEMAEYLDLYNITAVVTVSSDLAGDMKNLEDMFSEMKPIGRHRVYLRTDGRNSKVLRGDGTRDRVVVSAFPNLIRVSGAGKGSFTIKYHYVKTLASSDKRVTISPVFLLRDPVPFIEVRNPEGVSSFDIANTYGVENGFLRD